LPENKLHTAEFEKCVEQVMKQGHEKGSAFAICTATFQRAGKPIYETESGTQKLHLFAESIKIDGNKVSGVAIHPKRIFHPEEGMTHVYLREELERAAPTLVGKPFGIDHQYVLPPPNVVTNAWYDRKQDGVAFEGFVDNAVAEQIRNKAFKGLSIELDWLKPGGKVEYVNGVAPRNFELTSVHLLKKFPPGDKQAFISLWNSIREQLVAGPPLPLDQRVSAVEKQIQEVFNQINVINGKLEVLVFKASESSSSVMSESMSTIEGQSGNDDVVALRKKIFGLEVKLVEAEKTKTQQVQALKKRHMDFRRLIESTIPPSHIWKAWTPGPQKLIQAQLKVLRESVESQS